MVLIVVTPVLLLLAFFIRGNCSSNSCIRGFCSGILSGIFGLSASLKELP